MLAAKATMYLVTFAWRSHLVSWVCRVILGNPARTYNWRVHEDIHLF